MWIVLGGLCLGGAGCKPRHHTSSAIKSVATSQKTLELSPDDRGRLYHFSQGAEILPYAVVKAIKVKFNGNWVSPFDPALIRQYGLIADKKDPKTNPEGLPVGFTLATAPETGLLSLGFTCALCHVGELTYKNSNRQETRLRLDGGTNSVKIQDYLDVVIKSLDENTNTVNGLFFLKRVLEAQDYINKNLSQFRENSRSRIDSSSKLDNVKEQTAMLKAFMEIARRAKVDEGKTGSVTDDLKITEYIRGLPVTSLQKRLLFSRYYFLRARKFSEKYISMYGPGRTDPWGSIKLTLLGDTGFSQAPNAPLKAPRLYHIEQYEWLHFFSNTNGIVERDAGNGLGLGSVVDTRPFPEADGSISPPTFNSTMRLDNMIEIERLFGAIAPPQWPKDATPINMEKVKAGEEVYRNNCRGCHEPKANDKGLLQPQRYISIEEVGTDSQYTENLKSPLKTNRISQQDFLEGFIGPLMKKIKLAFYEKANWDSKTQAIWENRFDPTLNPTGQRGEEVWRNTLLRNDGKHIHPRPLDGVWAMAPYLHNGSVPTIYDLLQPADKRPSKFYLGHRDYDMTKLGYVVRTEKDPNHPESDFLFDTSLKGNANRGHEFGNDLTEEQRWNLIEFLKGFGGGRSTPVVLK